MELFGVGAGEALVVMIITLIVVGPHRFPEIAREGGRYYRIARRYANEVMTDVRGAMEELEAEVTTQKGELSSLQDELREGITAPLEETRTEIRELGRSTEQVLKDADPSKPAPSAASNGGAGASNGAARTPDTSSGALLTPRELPSNEDETSAGRDDG